MHLLNIGNHISLKSCRAYSGSNGRTYSSSFSYGAGHIANRFLCWSASNRRLSTKKRWNGRSR